MFEKTEGLTRRDRIQKDEILHRLDLYYVSRVKVYLAPEDNAAIVPQTHGRTTHKAISQRQCGRRIIVQGIKETRSR